jgi:hypothetical protein
VHTQAWLASSHDQLARSTGGYFQSSTPRAPNPVASDVGIQEKVPAGCDLSLHHERKHRPEERRKGIPSFPGLTPALGVLKRGFVLVGSVSTADGKFATIKAGPLAVSGSEWQCHIPLPLYNQA